MKLKMPPDTCKLLGIPTSHTIRIAPVKKGGDHYVKVFWWDKKEKKHKSKHIGRAKSDLEPEQQVEQAVKTKKNRLQEEERARTLVEMNKMAPTPEVLTMMKRWQRIRGFSDAGDPVAQKYEEMIKKGECHSAWAWRRIREVHRDLMNQMEELGLTQVDLKGSINVFAKMSKLGLNPCNPMDIRRYLNNEHRI